MKLRKQQQGTNNSKSEKPIGIPVVDAEGNLIFLPLKAKKVETTAFEKPGVLKNLMLASYKTGLFGNQSNGNAGKWPRGERADFIVGSRSARGDSPAGNSASAVRQVEDDKTELLPLGEREELQGAQRKKRPSMSFEDVLRRALQTGTRERPAFDLRPVWEATT